MENWVISIIEQFGYIGILLLTTLENVFPPIPSEVILTFGGFMTTRTSLTVIGVIVSSTIGSVVGAIILYYIGLFFDIHKLEKVIEKWGHILRLTKQDLMKANQWFSNYGVWTVFFCRFIPLIRSLISIPAGMARMNFLIFLLFTTLGTLIWNVALVIIGARVGKSWESIVSYFDVFSNIITVVIVVGIVLLIVFVKRKKRR